MTELSFLVDLQTNTASLSKINYCELDLRTQTLTKASVSSGLLCPWPGG